jgi:hypothetical protein
MSEPQNRRSPEALREVFERSTKPIGGGARPSVPRRTITFSVDHTICAPGIFEADFELTLMALTPGEELAAAREGKGDVLVMASSMARRSMHSFNGAQIDRSSGHDEWLWEVLGSGGRQIVTAMFAFVGTPGEEALGKAQTSLRVG